MRRFLTYSIFIFCSALAWFPIFGISHEALQGLINLESIAALNLIGWSLVLYFLFLRADLRRSIEKTAHEFGISTHFNSLELIVWKVLSEIQRKNSSLSINLIERKIISKEELSRTLERIVGLAYRLLSAESAELALFDAESGLYHSSFVMGKPFRSSSQAMLSGAIEGEEGDPSPDVLVQPIAFAGSILGSLRVALRRGELPSLGDREVMRILALQSGLAIINSEYTTELVKMKKLSEESVRAKTGFLANLSHEIRGPLGIMLNAVELVLDGLCGPINDDQLETLRMVRSNGEHLLELINDVLDYAKIESGKISPNFETLAVNELLRDMAGVVRTQAEAKSHKLIYRESDEALAISCDRRHVRQMMINLLTNAIKYTPDGGTIELWAERAPGNRIKLNVRDTGVGIDELSRVKVFAPFERVENSYSMNQIGAGLGMSLTKSLAEVNGGRIDFQSVPGEGSHFWLLFGAAQFDRSARSDTKASSVDARGKGEVILLVESSEGERNMMARYLRHIGFKVVSASTQVEALEILRKGDVDLGILDNTLVDRPDEDLVRGIREIARSNLLPIVLISTRAFVFDIEKYLKSGIDLCLFKPVALKKLGRICRQLIDGENSSKTVADQAGGHETGTPTKEISIQKLLDSDDLVH